MTGFLINIVMAKINMFFSENLITPDKKNSLSWKRKFRWMLWIPDICDGKIDTLPPSKSARPNLSFKEIEVQHLTETIYLPGKPEWKTLDLTLYDVYNNCTIANNCRNPKTHPIINWVNKLYEVNDNDAKYLYSNNYDNKFTVPRAILYLLDGCGSICETWVYENVWLQSVDFGELNMADSDILYVDCVLRYARGYWSRESVVGG